MNHTLRTTIPLFVLCAVLVGHSYTSGQWAEPSTAPTGGNAAAPLNVSGTGQVKSGTLGVGGLDVTGAADVTGRLTVENGAPTVYLRDTNSARSSFIHQNSDTFYVLSDRNNDGAWDTDGSWPLQITIGATAGNDLVSFSNRIRVNGPASEVRANQYCNFDASICFDAGDVASGGGFAANQRWYNVAGSRAESVWYQNNTGRYIAIYVQADNGASATIRYNTSASWTGNVTIASHDASSGTWDNVYGIIPPGGWYLVDTNGYNIRVWSELR